MARLSSFVGALSVRIASEWSKGQEAISGYGAQSFCYLQGYLHHSPSLWEKPGLLKPLVTNVSVSMLHLWCMPVFIAFVLILFFPHDIYHELRLCGLTHGWMLALLVCGTRLSWGICQADQWSEERGRGNNEGTRVKERRRKYHPLVSRR